MNFSIKIFTICILVFVSNFCLSLSANTLNTNVLNKIFDHKKSQSFNLIYKDFSELILLNKNQSTSIGKDKVADVVDLVLENRYLNINDEIVNQIKFSKNYVFFNAVISPFNGKIAFVERVLYKPIWNLRIYDPHNNTYEKVYSEKNCPIDGICLRPIGWNNDNNLLLDGFDINAGIENQSLWLHIFDDNSLSQVLTKGKYIGTPLVTPNGESFLYMATSEPTKDILHGTTDEVWIKDFNSSIDILFMHGASLSLKGWTTKSKESLSLIPLNNSVRSRKKSERKIKLPFEAGTKVYVTRHGKEDPINHGRSPGNGILCYYDDNDPTNDIHQDKIAIDFSNKESGACKTGGTGDDQIPIIASETGTVIFSGDNNDGYGELIKVATDILKDENGNYIKIPGEFITYYAHLSKRVVDVNTIVDQGTLIGFEGNTGKAEENTCIRSSEQLMTILQLGIIWNMKMWKGFPHLLICTLQ